MKIHPTAIIGDNAQIADDVEIGPYALIEGDAVIGPGCVIQAHAILTGTVRFGQNNHIGYGAIIGAPPQALAFKPETKSEVVIGDNNVIREYATIHRGMHDGGATRIGSHNFLMAGAHIAHDCTLGDHVVIANNVLLAGHVEVQDRVFIGGGSTFHQNIRVGTLAMIQGMSGFGKDIPPFTLALAKNYVGGLNIIGMRRAGFTLEQRTEIKNAFKLLYKSGLNVRQALENAGQHHWGEHGRRFFDFVAAAKKRGICDLRDTGRGWRDEDDGGE